MAGARRRGASKDTRIETFTHAQAKRWNIPTAELRNLGGPTSPIKAIRAKCVDCSGGSLAEARKCVAIRCALWPFRQGVNTFHGAREAENPAANLGGFSAAKVEVAQ